MVEFEDLPYDVLLLVFRELGKDVPPLLLARFKYVCRLSGALNHHLLVPFLEVCCNSVQLYLPLEPDSPVYSALLQIAAFDWLCIPSFWPIGQCLKKLTLHILLRATPGIPTKDSQLPAHVLQPLLRLRHLNLRSICLRLETYGVTIPLAWISQLRQALPAIPIRRLSFKTCHRRPLGDFLSILLQDNPPLDRLILQLGQKPTWGGCPVLQTKSLQLHGSPCIESDCFNGIPTSLLNSIEHLGLYPVRPFQDALWVFSPLLQSLDIVVSELSSAEAYAVFAQVGRFKQLSQLTVRFESNEPWPSRELWLDGIQAWPPSLGILRLVLVPRNRWSSTVHLTPAFAAAFTDFVGAMMATQGIRFAS